MPHIKVADLSLNQLTYAVGLAEVEKGVYTSDPLAAGLPKSFTTQVFAQAKFKEQYGDLNIDQVPPFLEDRDGVFWLWGSGEWMVGTVVAGTGLPHISHGPGGKFTPLKDGVYILEREQITTTPGRRGPMNEKGQVDSPKGWTAWSIHSEDDESEGATLLEAGLRCYVHSVFGDFVNLPSHVK